MIMTLFAQGIRDFWSPSHEGFSMVDLAVKDTQGAAVKAALAVLAQFLQMRTEIVLQEGAVLRAAFRAADGIDLEFKVLEAKPFEDRNSKQDGFRIHHRGRGAHRFDAKLMELSHAASLGTVVPEHGSDIEDLQRHRFSIEFIFDEGTYDSSRIFGTKRNASATAVVERIHFLINNVRTVTDASLEEFRMLEDWRADFLIVEFAANVAQDGFDIPPAIDRAGQDVLGTTGCRC